MVSYFARCAKSIHNKSQARVESVYAVPYEVYLKVYFFPNPCVYDDKKAENALLLPPTSAQHRRHPYGVKQRRGVWVHTTHALVPLTAEPRGLAAQSLLVLGSRCGS